MRGCVVRSSLNFPFTIVHFYSHIQQGWPLEDVHGGCQRPDYIARDPGYGCMVLPSWFADMMTGRVVENGLSKGILQSEWAYFGTPLARFTSQQKPRSSRHSNTNASRS